VNIDVEDAIQPRECDQNAFRKGQRSAGEPSPGTARDKRHVMFVAQPHDGLNLRCR